ncbi:MAG: AbrB/MazE/SpoVT family DNA-binding domain-containing protein [Hyphomicrobiales bacterium]
MRMTSKGQVTIPKHVRDRAGIRPGAELSVVYDHGVVKILRNRRNGTADEDQAYEAWLKRIKGTATDGVTTDEILKATRERE